MEINTLLDELIKREGGFVNDPDDPGGATKYGITIGTLSNYRGYRVKVSDVRNLTQREARQIYVSRYLERPRIDELPASIIPNVFDMYVNAGRNAIKLLQGILREFGEDISIDGIIGDQTIAAACRVDGQAGTYLNDAYAIARRNYYYDLAERRPKSRKYARTRSGGKGGWIRRAEEFMSKKYHYSNAEHQSRVLKWG